MSDKPVVLVVDDELPIRQLVEDILGDAGFRVVLAEDGDAGLALFQSESPDLVLLDILMPEMNGWDVLLRIRESSDCPVIMLTALGGIPDKVRALDEGEADDYLVKPIGPDELVARVKAVMRRRRPLPR